MPKQKTIDEAVAKKIQVRLKAAAYGTTPKKLFKRYDKSGDGSLDVKELQRALRRDLKITPEELSDADIDALVEALDDDGSMSLSIDELADFVERGTATFFSGPSDDAAPVPAPDESQALAFPGGMNDPNLPLVLRLRDDAIVSKDRQIAVISGQNDQLRGSLEQMEAEIASMLETLVGKDRELQKQQRTLDKRERELSRLRVVQSQSEGKDQAMEVSSKQNASLLQLLEETEEKARELGLENGALKDELKRQTFFAEKRVTKATNAHERIKADLTGEKLRAGVLEEQRAALSSSLAASTTRGARIELEARTELEAIDEELVNRRDRAYHLMLKLQAATDGMRRAEDEREAQCEATQEARERAAELHARLEAALAKVSTAQRSRSQS